MLTDTIQLLIYQENEDTMILEPHTVPVQVALEYAFAAYRVNNGYLTDSKKDKDDNVVAYANKDLVGRAVRRYVNEGSHYAHSVVFDIEVTNNDRENAAQVDEHFKKYMFKSLAGKLRQFENDVYTAVCGETVSFNRAGLIAYVPELIKRDLELWNFEKMLKTEYKNSQVSVDKTVRGNMIILSVRKLKKDFENFTVVIAGMNGNLYQFYKKEMTEDSVGKIYNIGANVKKGDFEYNTRIPLTVLNYVKVAPCRNQ
jgi:nitrogen fixation protein